MHEEYGTRTLYKASGGWVQGAMPVVIYTSPGFKILTLRYLLGRTNGLRHDRVNSGPFPQTFKTLPGINDRGGYRGPEVTICSWTQGTSNPLCCLFLKDMKMSTSGHPDGILRYW